MNFLKNKAVVISIIVVILIVVYGMSRTSNPPVETPETPSATDEPQVPPTPAPKPVTTTPSATGKNEVIVSPQKPGSFAVIDQVTLAVPGFVVIHEENRGQIGGILGFSSILPKGVSKNVRVNVTLTPGAGYIALLHSDSDGSKNFVQNIDAALKDLSGNPAMANFYASAPTTTSVTSYTVTIKNYAYSPTTTTVKRGDLVYFRNDDTTLHTVTANAFGGSHVIEIGKSYSLDTKNLAAGTYTYTCDYHPNMKGTLVVQ